MNGGREKLNPPRITIYRLMRLKGFDLLSVIGPGYVPWAAEDPGRGPAGPDH